MPPPLWISLLTREDTGPAPAAVKMAGGGTGKFSESVNSDRIGKVFGSP